MSEPITPASIVATLTRIGHDLDEKADEVAQLDEDFVRLKGGYKRQFAQSFLSTPGSNDVRRYTAELECADLLLEQELAEQVLRAARESLRVLRDRLEIGRSLSALLRTEWAS